MTQPLESLRQRLVDALEQSDSFRRAGRADRILWLSQHQVDYGVVSGSVEALSLLGEARDCYGEGHYIAALLLASAFIEHAIAEALVAGGHAQLGISFKKAIVAARDSKLFPSDLLDRTDQLRLIRNPFAHRKSDDDPNTLGSRYIASGRHPRSVLEQDAQEALQLMFSYFRHALKCD